VAVWQPIGAPAELVGLLRRQLQAAVDHNPLLSLREVDLVSDQAELDRLASRAGPIGDPQILLLRGERLCYRIPVTPATPPILQRELGGGLVAIFGEHRTPVFRHSGRRP
jgi:hypothetical protein